MTAFVCGNILPGSLKLLFSNSKNLWWGLAASALIGMIIAPFFLHGGDDLYRYYLPFADGCLSCGYMPYFAQWFLAPLRFLPAFPFAWPVWTVFSAVGLLILTYYTDVNPVLFLISFPLLGQIWLGQVDVLVCAGMVLFLFGKTPVIRGIGIGLALMKPQLTGIMLVACLLLERKADLWKILIVPAFIFVASLIVYGFQWPLAWLTNALIGLPAHVWRLASLDVWKFGLVLLPVPLLFVDRRERAQVALLVSALSTPFFGVYSYIMFLMLDTRPWYVIISFAWVLAIPWLGKDAMRLAWTLPLAILLDLLWRWYQRRIGKLPDPPQVMDFRSSSVRKS
jgi:hypothetical protein